MKTTLTLVLIVFATITTGCSDKTKEAEKAREDAAAKARADAAKKEMEKLPQVFQSRDIFKKNEPAKPVDATTSNTTTAKKP